MANKTQSWVRSILVMALAVSIGWFISTSIDTKAVNEDDDFGVHGPSYTKESHNIEDHSDGTMDPTGSHMHAPIELGESETNPTLQITATEDPDTGWNLQLTTTNFTFTPELVGTDPVMNEGHAHLYIDGEKLTRLYTDWYYLGELKEGSYTIRVDLNANDHAPFAVNGELIQDEILVHVEANAEDNHAHEDPDTHVKEALEEAAAGDFITEN